MSLESIARTGSYADFLKAYRKRARVFRRHTARKLYSGKSLVMWALGNNSMEDRYAMVDFLLEQGAVPGPPNPYGDGPLHVLFSQDDWDSARDARIAVRLIEMGADINLRNDKGMVPLTELLLRKGTRAQMAPPLPAVPAGARPGRHNTGQRGPRPGGGRPPPPRGIRPRMADTLPRHRPLRLHGRRGQRRSMKGRSGPLEGPCRMADGVQGHRPLRLHGRMNAATTDTWSVELLGVQAVPE